MIQILHLSDPHFGTENFEVMNALENKIKDINPDIIVISGDLTQRARTFQFLNAKKFFDKLPGIKLVIPGNHDIPLFNLVARAFYPYRNLKKFYQDRFPQIKFKNLTVLGIDATTPCRHTKGFLSIKKTEELLKSVKNKMLDEDLLALVIHQPIFVSRPEDLKNLLINSDSLVSLFSQYKVDMILSGHIHLPYYQSARILLQKIEWSFLFFGAGTVISKRVRPPTPNSFFQIEINDNCSNNYRLTVSRYDYLDKEFRFIYQSKFCRTSTGWEKSDL
jgi:3',5'-cyclic AMP phosphodiesterase CpdA